MAEALVGHQRALIGLEAILKDDAEPDAGAFRLGDEAHRRPR